MEDNIEVCRVMRADDSNLAGNVHGGTILKLIEEAGEIVATRFCNKGDGPGCYAALARVERTDFVEPMFVGEIAQIHAELGYASTHSLEVNCTVYSEDVVKHNRRLTNRASMWYVPLAIEPPHKVVSVPPVTYRSEEEEAKGRARYEQQKASRVESNDMSANGDDDLSAPGTINVLTPAGRSLFAPYSVNYSNSSLIVMLHPSDCNSSGFASGGSTMKKMDNVAGIVAFRHCRSNVVTASVEAVNFHRVVRKGEVMTITGRPIFSSNRSLDIEVFVDCEDIVQGKSFRACSAIFSFVSLNKEGKPQLIPELKLETDIEKWRAELGKKRYLAKKDRRKRKVEAATSEGPPVVRQMSVN